MMTVQSHRQVAFPPGNLRITPGRFSGPPADAREGMHYTPMMFSDN
jgi:hypothetical protein